MIPQIRGPHVRIDVPPDDDAVPGVRRQVVLTALAWGLSRVADLEMVSSELVTNAVVHARTPSVLTLSLLAPDYVEVTVADSGPGEPVLGQPEPDDLAGRGLRIVDALSTRWGVDPGAGPGKTVWARVGRPR